MRPHTSVRVENESFFIRVWKPLPSIRVLKILRKNSKRTVFTSGGLGLLQMVSELDNGDVSVRRLSLEGGENRRRCVSKDVGPQREMNWGSPLRLEKRTSVSEDT